VPRATHEEKVERIAESLRRRPPRGPLKIKKASCSHQVPRHPSLSAPAGEFIDVSELDQILDIDREARTCVAEPGVTFEQLVKATLPLGLAPRVVPELKGITLGGAVSGCSVESGSFRHGGFHDLCYEYELLTSRGERRLCAPGGPDPLLFQMLHGTFGTLGVITRLKFHLAPARPFVHLRYARSGDLAGFVDSLQRHERDPDVDFLDGFIHGPQHYVLNIGRYVDSAPYTHRYDWVRVYCDSTRRRAEDYLTAAQYFFRYDRGVTNTHPKSLLGRLLFGRLLDSSRLLELAERMSWLLPRHQPGVTVDTFVPLSRAARYLDWYAEALRFYPVWVVPYRRVRDYEWIAPSFLAGLEDTLLLDLAVYGMAQPRGRNVYREIEEALARVGGLKTLISHNYYSAEEFWRVWNHDTYRQVKDDVDPLHLLPDLYEKMCPEGARQHAAAGGSGVLVPQCSG
jgi:FAD/FMN-containing dehydrogenase